MADLIVRNLKGQFEKGYSGNSTGRTQGSRNKATLAILELFNEESEALSRQAIESAKKGDSVALKLCIDKIVPQAKESPIRGLTLPAINDAKDVLEALNLVTQLLADGELLPTEADKVCSILEQFRKHFDTTEFQDRLEALELINEVSKAG